MTREELIEAIVEVFDDTYSAGVFGRGDIQLKKKKSASDLIRLARKLKATRKVPSSLFGPTMMKINRGYRGAG